MTTHARDVIPARPTPRGPTVNRIGPLAASLVQLRRWRLTLPGCGVALVFICLSLTPSLLPRTWLFQGIVTGISAVIGYGVGVLGAWVWRQYADRGPRPAGPRSWHILLVSAAVAVPTSVVVGQFWQRQVRDLMGMPYENPLWQLAVPLVAGLLFALVLTCGRGLRALNRWLVARFARHVGLGAARATGFAVVLLLTVAVVSGVVRDGLVALADRTFSIRDEGTPAGIERPESPLRSGSTGSLIPWDSLGREGRKFTAGGPTAERISKFTGEEALEPIRAYAGLESADDVDRRAALAVNDLERAGGFERQNLLVLTTTGSGWVEPASAAAFEYISGGDSAIVTIQYSYLPSWISYLVDQDRAREAGRELFDAVYGRWIRMPEDERPNLYVFGESLGSFGAETAFSGEHDIANRTDGVLFAGPPNFNTLYREFTDERSQGTPEVEPVYRKGRTVRFSNSPHEEIPPADGTWQDRRVLYLQHASDPIVWWSPSLLWDRPDWLHEPRGEDVLATMEWFPVVTFWHVTADLPLAVGVPGGHGHVYTDEHVNGWVAVMQPEGWTRQRTAELRRIITGP